MTTSPGTIVPTWSLADRLRKAREVAGLDQAGLAKALGVARSSIGNYEQGNTKPRRPTLLAYALCTGVSYDWLVTGVEPPKRPGHDEVLPQLDSNQQPAGWLPPLVMGAVACLAEHRERRRAVSLRPVEHTPVPAVEQAISRILTDARPAAAAIDPAA